MPLFLLQRLFTLLLTLLGASLVVFVVLEILPGNAAEVLLGPDAAPEAVAALAVQLGLDQPAWQRYGQWLAGLLTGDLGDSHA
jgi:peptide/nickel transport system permease protein